MALQWKRTMRGLLLSYTSCSGGYWKALAWYKVYEKVFHLEEIIKINHAKISLNSFNHRSPIGYIQSYE